MSESFKPISHHPPEGLFNIFKFFIRLILDFQVLTVYRDLKKFKKEKHGKLLDLGCGAMPYKHLLDTQFEYLGMDYTEASLFGYEIKVIQFDGVSIPINDSSIDVIICTEVLEHTQQPQSLVDSMYRVLKESGTAFVTIPWSARYHYIPYDYYRYTPSAIKLLFKNFSQIEIVSRGTDITVIVSKIILVFARQFNRSVLRFLIATPFVIILSPLLIALLCVGHLSLIVHIGSAYDPLGYTVRLKK